MNQPDSYLEPILSRQELITTLIGKHIQETPQQLTNDRIYEPNVEAFGIHFTNPALYLEVQDEQQRDIGVGAVDLEALYKQTSMNDTQSVLSCSTLMGIYDGVKQVVEKFHALADASEVVKMFAITDLELAEQISTKTFKTITSLPVLNVSRLLPYIKQLNNLHKPRLYAVLCDVEEEIYHINMDQLCVLFHTMEEGMKTLLNREKFPAAYALWNDNATRFVTFMDTKTGGSFRRKAVERQFKLDGHARGALCTLPADCAYSVIQRAADVLKVWYPLFGKSLVLTDTEIDTIIKAHLQMLLTLQTVYNSFDNYCQALRNLHTYTQKCLFSQSTIK